MSTIKTSLHGSLLGLDHSNYLTGPVGAKLPVLYLGTSGSEALVDIEGLTTVTSQSSAASTLAARGVSRLDSTINQAYQLAAPIAGVRKVIFNTTASTGQVVSSTGVGASFQSTGGSTHISATFPIRGSALELVGLSTSLWAVVTNQGAAVFG